MALKVDAVCFKKLNVKVNINQLNILKPFSYILSLTYCTQKDSSAAMLALLGVFNLATR